MSAVSVGMNANGVSSCSPGLLALASYPGWRSTNAPPTLKGLHRPDLGNRRFNPLQG
jgi:hypothetical protein